MHIFGQIRNQSGTFYPEAGGAISAALTHMTTVSGNSTFAGGDTDAKLWFLHVTGTASTSVTVRDGSGSIILAGTVTVSSPMNFCFRGGRAKGGFSITTSGTTCKVTVGYDIISK